MDSAGDVRADILYCPGDHRENSCERNRDVLAWQTDLPAARKQFAEIQQIAEVEGEHRDENDKERKSPLTVHDDVDIDVVVVLSLFVKRTANVQQQERRGGRHNRFEEVESVLRDSHTDRYDRDDCDQEC